MTTSECATTNSMDSTMSQMPEDDDGVWLAERWRRCLGPKVQGEGRCAKGSWEGADGDKLGGED